MQYGCKNVADIIDGKGVVAGAKNENEAPIPHTGERKKRPDERSGIFVSYKSEDVAMMQTVAEQMKSCKEKVWFAEYDILIKDRAMFRKKIEQAIGSCAFGVCFTNDRYANSEHCRHEMELLLEHVGPERIVEIAIPRQPLTHKLFPALASAPSFEVPPPNCATYGPNARGLARSFIPDRHTVECILEHVSEKTGLRLAGSRYVPPKDSSRRSFKSSGIKYSLDFGGWEWKRPSILERLFVRGGGDAMGPKFSRKSRRGILSGHLIVGDQDVNRKKNRGRNGG